MTEDQIERIVERRIDAIDREYLNSSMDQAEYNRRLEEVDAWAERVSRQPTRFELFASRAADIVDGYNRDDLGLSPDY